MVFFVCLLASIMFFKQPAGYVYFSCSIVTLLPEFLLTPRIKTFFCLNKFCLFTCIHFFSNSLLAMFILVVVLLIYFPNVYFYFHLASFVLLKKDKILNRKSVMTIFV